MPMERDDIERLKEIFVTRQECECNMDDVKKKLSRDATELALIKQKLDVITLTTKASLTAIITSVVGYVVSQIFG